LKAKTPKPRTKPCKRINCKSSNAPRALEIGEKQVISADVRLSTFAKADTLNFILEDEDDENDHLEESKKAQLDSEWSVESSTREKSGHDISEKQHTAPLPYFNEKE